MTPTRTSLERRLFSLQIPMRIRLARCRSPCEITDDAPLPLCTLQDPLVDAQPFQPDGPPRVRLARRDAHLGTQAESLSIGKPRRSVDENVGGRDPADKVGRLDVGRGQDRVGMMGRVDVDVFHRASNVGDRFDGELEVEVFRIERFGSGSSDERVRERRGGEGRVRRRVQVERDVGTQ